MAGSPETVGVCSGVKSIICRPQYTRRTIDTLYEFQGVLILNMFTKSIKIK